MMDPYSQPSTHLLDDARNKRRIVHGVVTAISSFIFTPVIVIAITYALTKSLDIVTISARFLMLNTASAVLAGLAIYPFRSLAWYWAAFMGPVIGFTSMFAIGIIITSLGLK